MSNEPKERMYIKVMDHKDKLKHYFTFKSWYMEHSIEWMEGFNKACEILFKYIEEVKQK